MIWISTVIVILYNDNIMIYNTYIYIHDSMMSIGDANYGCGSHIESDVPRSQVLDFFKILRLSTCWSTSESGFLDDLKQNLIQTWTRWGSPFSKPCFASMVFFDVFFCVRRASQESMKSRASLKGLSSRNKRENPLLWRPQSWLFNTFEGAIVWTSCAALS